MKHLLLCTDWVLARTQLPSLVYRSETVHEHSVYDTPDARIPAGKYSD